MPTEACLYTNLSKKQSHGENGTHIAAAIQIS